MAGGEAVIFLPVDEDFLRVEIEHGECRSQEPGQGDAASAGAPACEDAGSFVPDCCCCGS
jgi:hypothetical protein